MRALVLAAGLGERLRPLTNSVPKPLVEVGGRPLIHYPLMMLRSAGFTEIAINTHHLAEQMESALGDGRALGISIHWLREVTLSGSGGPLNALRDFLGADRFAIVNADSILDLDMTAMTNFHSARAAAATIALAQPDNMDYYSRIEIDGDARVRRMRLLYSVSAGTHEDFPGDLAEGVAAVLESWMYCGVIIAEPQVLREIPSRPRWELFGGLWAPMVARGDPVFGWRHQRYFGTVNDLPGLDRLRAEFASNPPALAYLK